jgi:two-component system invasion response regulator UvrY
MRVLIVDDHPLMRMGIRQLVLQEWPDAEVNEAPSIAEAITCARVALPALITLDLMLPDAHGIEGASRLLRAVPGVPLLVLSLNAEEAYAARVIQLGASGYLPKDRAADELRVALRRLAEGGRYVTPTMADHLLGLLSGKAPQSLPHEQLSTQEHRVMLLIAAGMTPAQIAATMHLSVKTVGSYRARILEKGGWANNTELTKYCVQHGLTDL